MMKDMKKIVKKSLATQKDFDIWLNHVFNNTFKVGKSIVWSIFFKNENGLEEVKCNGVIVKVNHVTVDVKKEDGSVVRLDQRDLITVK